MIQLRGNAMDFERKNKHSDQPREKKHIIK
jgi:hypothetical protein